MISEKKESKREEYCGSVMKQDLPMEAACDMLYLGCCVLTGQLPEFDRVAKMNWKQVYAVSRFHSLAALVCEALEKIEISNISQENKKIFSVFQETKMKAIRKNLLLDTEREKLFTYLETQGIWYLPLKGIVFKDMYPKMGLRQMADNDILFDAAYQKEVCDWFVSRGYEAVSVGKSVHDIYEKKPIYNYEMHTALFGEIYNPVWYAYYKEIKKKLVQDDGKNYGYHFTDEDFYIYILTHTFKHFEGSGTGVRFLMDLYVYLKQKQENMNWQYIESELECLGIGEFAADCKSLVEILFADVEKICLETLPEKELQLLICFLTSGTYGTSVRNLQNKMDKLEKTNSGWSKWLYLKKRIFPDRVFMKAYYPFFYQYKFLIPFGYIYRIIKGICIHPRKLLRETNRVWKYKKKPEELRYSETRGFDVSDNKE